MSRLGEILFFAPDVPFAAFDKTGYRLPTQLYQRINGFYVAPAITLANSKDAFASGLLIVCAMDHLGHLISGTSGSGARFKDCCRLIPDLSAGDTPDVFYHDFRNGLVHGGRVQNASEFKLDLGRVARHNGERLVVDPLQLACAFKGILKNYIVSVYNDPNQHNRLVKRLTKTFNMELTG
jgi:hypothetical protein